VVAHFHYGAASNVVFACLDFDWDSHYLLIRLINDYID
jgi:hypothetical protein